MKLLVDIPGELNKKLKIDKIRHGLKNIQEMLIKILEEYYAGKGQ